MRRRCSNAAACLNRRSSLPSLCERNNTNNVRRLEGRRRAAGGRPQRNTHTAASGESRLLAHHAAAAAGNHHPSFPPSVCQSPLLHVRPFLLVVSTSLRAAAPTPSELPPRSQWRCLPSRPVCCGMDDTAQRDRKEVNLRWSQTPRPFQKRATGSRFAFGLAAAHAPRRAHPNRPCDVEMRPLDVLLNELPAVEENSRAAVGECPLSHSLRERMPAPERLSQFRQRVRRRGRESAEGSREGRGPHLRKSPAVIAPPLPIPVFFMSAAKKAPAQSLSHANFSERARSGAAWRALSGLQAINLPSPPGPLRRAPIGLVICSQ